LSRSMVYRLSSDKSNTLPLTLECKTKSKSVFLNIKVDEQYYKNLIINKSQYFYLELNFT
jgi:hypothetical protein